MNKILQTPYLILALALVGLAVAFYDSYALYNSQPLWCPPPINGCNEVATSPYARIFDLPVGYFGMVYYGYVAGLAVLLVADRFSFALRAAALVMAAAGVGFSIYFAYLQIAYIHAFCVYCLISAMTTVLLLVSAAAQFRAMRSGFGVRLADRLERQRDPATPAGMGALSLAADGRHRR